MKNDPSPPFAARHQRASGSDPPRVSKGPPSVLIRRWAAGGSVVVCLMRRLAATAWWCASTC